MIVISHGKHQQCGLREGGGCGYLTIQSRLDVGNREDRTSKNAM
jgi:hypothetical protein